MYKIAICDAYPADINYMEEILHRSLFAYQGREIYKFRSGNRLLDKLPERFDLILLGIDENEIETKKTAQRLRKVDKHALLLFCGKKEQAEPDLFRLCPSGFLVKGGEEKKNREVLNQVFRQMERRREWQITVVWGKGKAVTIRLEEIVSIHSSRGTSCLHLTQEALGLLHFPSGERFDRVEFTMPCHLEELQEKLRDWGFGCATRSCLVNFRHIRRIDACRILLSNGEEVSLAKARREEFDELFVDYLERSSAEDCRFLLMR